MIELLHISDSHLFADPLTDNRGALPAANLQRLIRTLAKRHPKARLLVHSGDLSEDGSPGSYQLLETLLRPLGKPVYAVPGNHDRPEVMRANLTGQPVHLLPALTVEEWRLVFLDSTLGTGESQGHLDSAALEQLHHDLLDHPDHPALIVLHHPPVPVGTSWLDRIGLDNPEALFAVLQRHFQVRGVLFAHLHQPYTGQRGPLQLLGTPSTFIQFCSGTDKPVVSPDPPAYRRLVLHSDGTLESEVLYAE